MTSTLAPLGSSAAGPRVSTVRAASLELPSLCLDAKHYQAEFVAARSRVLGCGFETTPLSSIASAFVAPRAKMAISEDPEVGAPYLRAHDVFEARLRRECFLIQRRTEKYDSYLLKEGMILTPSSGRNLGPLAYVGRASAGFAMTDILRIVTHEPESAFYLLAYLRTPTGQALIRRGRTGTTVDHLGPDDVHAIPVPLLDESRRTDVTERMCAAVTRVDDARVRLDQLESELHDRAQLARTPPRGAYMPSPGARAFGVARSVLTLRIDAAFYDPQVTACRAALKERAHSTLAEVASASILGRYKRYYVADGHGTPILSGRQLLQLRPVNLQRISDRSFKDPASFRVQTGSTLFTCDGRAEEALGSPAFVHRRWAGWMASNHVMRAAPKDGVRPGYLYLALRSPYTQLQIKARATGSVVDALDPESVADVLVPRLPEPIETELGTQVEVAWENIARGLDEEDAAVADFERAIVSAYEHRGRARI